jgi:PIN domain nuclease of toxin-antitoxin system
MSCGSDTMTAVIDASALIAFLRAEPGVETVRSLLWRSQARHAHALNLCEFTPPSQSICLGRYAQTPFTVSRSNFSFKSYFP